MLPELNKNKNTHHSTISTDRSSEAKQTLYLLLCIYRPTHNSAVQCCVCVVLVLSIAAALNSTFCEKYTCRHTLHRKKSGRIDWSDRRNTKCAITRIA